MNANAAANFMRNVWSYTDHLLRSLPRRRPPLHRGGAGGRDPRGVVPAPGARHRELRGRRPAARHERQPRLPDRAPPVPRPAEQPVRRDQRSRCGRCATSTTSRTRPGPLYRQYGQALRVIIKLSLPNKYTKPNSPIQRRRTGKDVADREAPPHRRRAPVPAGASSAPGRGRRHGPSRGRRHDRHRGPVRVGGRRPLPRPGHPVRPEPDLRRLRGVARTARSRSSARSVESDRNEFHAPPLHAGCADDVRASLDPSWLVVHTAAFEFVRPGRDDLDQQVRFELVSRLVG